MSIAFSPLLLSACSGSLNNDQNEHSKEPPTAIEFDKPYQVMAFEDTPLEGRILAFQPYAMTSVGGRLFFSRVSFETLTVSYNARIQRSTWLLDADQSSAQQLAQGPLQTIYPGEYLGFHYNEGVKHVGNYVQKVDGSFYLTVPGSAGLWKSDGNIEGTSKVFSGTLVPSEMHVIGERLYFVHTGDLESYFGGIYGSKISVLQNDNITGLHSVSVENFSLQTSIYLDRSTEDSQYFWIYSPTFPTLNKTHLLQNSVLWRTQGSVESTEEVIDEAALNRQKLHASYEPYLIDNLNQQLASNDLLKSQLPQEYTLLLALPAIDNYYLLFDAADQISLWCYDSQSMTLKQLAENLPSAAQEYFVVWSNMLFFTKDYELWHTDGTATNTLMIEETFFQQPIEQAANAYPVGLTIAGNTLYFIVNRDSKNSLWALDLP